MKVYVVLMSWPYEGSELHSVFADRESAQALCDKFREDDRYTDFRVVEEEVRGADKEKAPESSDPEACFLCKRDFSKCRCLPL